MWAFFLLIIFPFDLNIVRQGAALSIVFYATRFIDRRYLSKYSLLVLLAVLFHASAALCFALYPLICLAERHFYRQGIWTIKHQLGWILTRVLPVMVLACLFYVFVVRQFTVAAYQITGSISNVITNPAVIIDIIKSASFTWPQYVFAIQLDHNNLVNMLLSAIISLFVVGIAVKLPARERAATNIIAILFVAISLPMSLFMATGWRVFLYLLPSALLFIAEKTEQKNYYLAMSLAAIVFILLFALFRLNGIVPYQAINMI